MRAAHSKLPRKIVDNLGEFWIKRSLRRVNDHESQLRPHRIPTACASLRFVVHYCWRCGNICDRHWGARVPKCFRDCQRVEQIAPWVIEHTDPEAIDDMKHPERSPYACLGPKGAKHGCDRSFLLSPELRPARVTLPNLTAPLSWRKDGSGLPPRVAKMARDFGYH